MCFSRRLSPQRNLLAIGMGQIFTDEQAGPGEMKTQENVAQVGLRDNKNRGTVETKGKIDKFNKDTRKPTQVEMTITEF